jgi:hypothetical protein
MILVLRRGVAHATAGQFVKDRIDRLRIPVIQHAQQAFDEESAAASGTPWPTVMARPVISVVLVAEC